PNLGPLQNNGGSTDTHALLSGSPAIDAGDPTAKAGVDGIPVYDQRGTPFVRIAGAAIDIGALETTPAAPQVVDVILGGSGWNADFVDAVDDGGVGAGNGLGYSLAGSHQLDSVPWFGANVLYVRFSKDVSASIADADVALTGTNGGSYTLGTLAYGVDGPNVLTIPVPGGIGADRLVLSIFDGVIEDGDGNALDGEWTSGQTTPSGEGTAGGRFDFFFNVLPGDVDGSLQVDAIDAQLAFIANGAAAAIANARNDVNASGLILADDAQLAFTNNGFGLPAPPTPPTAVVVTFPLLAGEDINVPGKPANPDVIDAAIEQLADEPLRRVKLNRLRGRFAILSKRPFGHIFVT
ncbi:MAG: hypothetical protein KDB27_24740, partial [Planctomycetales bacterium]|nr:hypothetical protein [Planctomycetales bacterium]